MKTEEKKFDAVVESRSWKEEVARQTTGTTRAAVLAFFNRPRNHDALEDAGKMGPR